MSGEVTDGIVFRAGMGYTDMDAFNGMGTPYTPESGAGPSRSAGVAGQSRSPIVGSRKGMETVIMIGTGSSGMWLNHIICATKSEPIRGTYSSCYHHVYSPYMSTIGQYYIDPNLEVQDHATARRAGALGLKVHSRSTSSLSTGSKSGKKKADYSWHPTAEPELCNGFFESKNSNIDILLNIGGQGSSKANKANVDVRSRSGKVAIKVTEIAEGRRLNLDTTTMKGDIEVFLPRTFSGPLHVHTEGEITLLPRLAATMEVIQAREDDALVMITSPRPSPSTSPAPSSRSHHDHSHKATGAATSSGGLSSWLHPGGGGGMRAQSYEGDYANLISSSGGNIIVGFLGEDKIKEESPGMWKKIVSLFTGERSNTS